MSRIALLSFLTTLAAGCSQASWRGFVYPDKSNLSDWRELGSFPTLDDCRASAALYLRDMHATEEGTYECGRNCRRRATTGLNECDETTR